MSASLSDLSSVSENTMLDESEHGELSPEPVERGKKRSHGPTIQRNHGLFAHPCTVND